MAETIPEVVVGATRKELRITFENETGAVVNITGGAVRLQGQSDDLPPKDLDVAGTIFDGPNGIARWVALGGTGYLVLTDLGSKAGATFSLRGKLTDAAGNVDWTPLFQLRWVRPPV